MRRIFEIHCPDGTVRRPVLEAGRWYGLDGLPAFVVLTLAKLVELTTPLPTMTEAGGWKVIGEVAE